MKLLGQHTIRASSLKGLKEALDKLPDSVLESGSIKFAEVDTIYEQHFGGWETATNWIVVLDLEWPVELA